ncbi:hypothetical protein Tco_0077635 [Tanacetum coccineum]
MVSYHSAKNLKASYVELPYLILKLLLLPLQIFTITEYHYSAVSVYKLLRELLPFVELYSGDIVSRNVLTLCIPSPFVIVNVVMVAIVGSWSGPNLYNFIQ